MTQNSFETPLVADLGQAMPDQRLRDVRVGVITFPGTLDDVDALRAVRLAGIGDGAVDQCQALDARWQGTGEQHRDDRAHGVPEQGKALPAELLGDLQHIVGIVPDVVPRAGRAVVRMAMPRQVERDDA